MLFENGVKNSKAYAEGYKAGVWYYLNKNTSPSNPYSNEPQKTEWVWGVEQAKYVVNYARQKISA